MGTFSKQLLFYPNNFKLFGSPSEFCYFQKSRTRALPMAMSLGTRNEIFSSQFHEKMKILTFVRNRNAVKINFITKQLKKLGTFFSRMHLSQLSIQNLMLIYFLYRNHSR